MAKSPFTFFESDPTALMAAFKMPGVDLESLMAAQRKNLEALTKANQLTVESIQTVAKRQAELVRESFQEAGAAMSGLMSGDEPAQRITHQTELAKKAVEDAVANAREVAEIFTKAASEAFEILNKRVVEGFDEAGAIVKAKGK
jgi:phasin family protein